METASRLLAICSDSLAALGGPGALPLALFVIGLAGSAVHCVGMCGPFVLGQVVSAADATRPQRYGEWRRLGGAALLPYSTQSGPEQGGGAPAGRAERVETLAADRQEA